MLLPWNFFFRISMSACFKLYWCSYWNRSVNFGCTCSNLPSHNCFAYYRCHIHNNNKELIAYSIEQLVHAIIFTRLIARVDRGKNTAFNTLMFSHGPITISSYLINLIHVQFALNWPTYFILSLLNEHMLLLQCTIWVKCNVHFFFEFNGLDVLSI